MGVGWSYYYYPGYYHPYYVTAVPVAPVYASPTYGTVVPVYGKISDGTGAGGNQGVSPEYLDHLDAAYGPEGVTGTPVADGIHSIDFDTFFEMAHSAIPETDSHTLRAFRTSAENHYQRCKENGTEEEEAAAQLKELSDHISEELVTRKHTGYDELEAVEGEDIDSEADHFDAAVLNNHRFAEKKALKERHEHDINVLKALSEASDVHELQANHKNASAEWKRMHVIQLEKAKDGKKQVTTVKAMSLTVRTYEEDYRKMMEMHDSLTYYYAITCSLHAIVSNAARNMAGHPSLEEYAKDQIMFKKSLAGMLKNQSYDFAIGMLYYLAFVLRSNPVSDLSKFQELAKYFMEEWEKHIGLHIDLERDYIHCSVAMRIGDMDEGEGREKLNKIRDELDVHTDHIATLFANLFAGPKASHTLIDSEYAQNIYFAIKDQWQKHVLATIEYVDLLTKKGFTRAISEQEEELLTYLESGQTLGKYLNALAYGREGDPLPRGEAMAFIKETYEQSLKEIPRRRTPVNRQGGIVPRRQIGPGGLRDSIGGGGGGGDGRAFGYGSRMRYDDGGYDDGYGYGGGYAYGGY